MLSFVQFRRNEAMRDRKNISNGGLGFSFLLNAGEICPNYENKSATLRFWDGAFLPEVAVAVWLHKYHGFHGLMGTKKTGRPILPGGKLVFGALGDYRGKLTHLKPLKGSVDKK